MSETELNKGKMIPVTESIEDVAERCIVDLKEYYSSKVEQFEDERWDYGYEILNGKLYKMEYEIESDTSMYYQHAIEDEDGIIEFFTIHYNGGGSLMEVIESCLENKPKPNSD